jgi:hypothetical protein
MSNNNSELHRAEKAVATAVMQLFQAEGDDCGRINEMTKAEVEARAAYWQQVGEELIWRGEALRSVGLYYRREWARQRRESARQAKLRAKPTATVLPFGHSETPPVAG